MEDDIPPYMVSAASQLHESSARPCDLTAQSLSPWTSSAITPGHVLSRASKMPGRNLVLMHERTLHTSSSSRVWPSQPPRSERSCALVSAVAKSPIPSTRDNLAEMQGCPRPVPPACLCYEVRAESVLRERSLSRARLEGHARSACRLMSCFCREINALKRHCRRAPMLTLRRASLVGQAQRVWLPGPWSSR